MCDNEYKTLAEHNVQQGDVVKTRKGVSHYIRCGKWGIAAYEKRMADNSFDPYYGMESPTEFRVSSRAAQKVKPPTPQGPVRMTYKLVPGWHGHVSISDDCSRVYAEMSTRAEVEATIATLQLIAPHMPKVAE